MILNYLLLFSHIGTYWGDVSMPTHATAEVVEGSDAYPTISCVPLLRPRFSLLPLISLPSL